MNQDSSINLWEIIGAGEYVLIAIGVLFIATIVIWIARFLTMRKAITPSADFMHRIRDYVVEGDLENARQLSAAGDLPVCRIIESGVVRIGHPISELADAVKETGRLEILSLKRGLRWLWWIASVSPLIGLGGTLAGISVSFRELSELDTMIDLGLMAQVLYPTFWTLIGGLIAGVVALTAYISLTGYVKCAEKTFGETAMSFLDLLNEPV